MRFTNYIENISSKRRKVVDDEQNIIKEDLKEDIKEDNNIDKLNKRILKHIRPIIKHFP